MRVVHPQITRARIEGDGLTLYYDYDQLREGKLSQLTDDGKIEWFWRRMNCLLNGVEALGSFMTPPSKARDKSKRNFFAFISTYMKSWDKNKEALRNRTKRIFS